MFIDNKYRRIVGFDVDSVLLVNNSGKIVLRSGETIYFKISG